MTREEKEKKRRLAEIFKRKEKIAVEALLSKLAITFTKRGD